MQAPGIEPDHTKQPVDGPDAQRPIRPVGNRTSDHRPTFDATDLGLEIVDHALAFILAGGGRADPANRQTYFGEAGLQGQ
jgi:hypothetical protein